MIGNILIVDDDSAALKLLQDILTAEGHLVRPFNNGELALRSVMAEAPELILLDIRMPGMSGFEVCRRFKADERLQEIPVIFISAASDLEDKVRAFQEGGVDYITKPFQKEEVIARVKTHIALSHTIQRKKKTAEALRVREESLKMAQAIAHFGHWQMKVPTGEMTWSDELYWIMGIEPQGNEPTYEAFIKAVHPDDKERVVRHIAQIREGGDLDIEFKIVLQDGHVRLVHGKTILLVSPGTDRSGTVKAGAEIVGVIQDITERKQAEIALLRSEDNLLRAQTVAQVGSWYLDIRTGRLEWTPESFRIFGIPQKEAVDLDTFFSTVHPDDREMVLKSWNEAIAGAPYDIEHRVVVGGEVRWVRELAVIERDSDGRAVSGIGTTQDITERKQADVEIRRLEREYRSLVENLPDIVSRFDRQLRRIYVNQALTQLTGLHPSSLLGKTVQEQDLPKPMKDANTNALGRVLSTGVAELVESKYWGADGTVKHYHTRVVPEFGTSGEVETILTISRDISTFKNTEAELRESEERLHAIASNVPSMVLQCCRSAGEDRLRFTYVRDGLNNSPPTVVAGR